MAEIYSIKTDLETRGHDPDDISYISDVLTLLLTSSKVCFSYVSRKTMFLFNSDFDFNFVIKALKLNFASELFLFFFMLFLFFTSSSLPVMLLLLILSLFYLCSIISSHSHPLALAKSSSLTQEV